MKMSSSYVLYPTAWERNYKKGGIRSFVSAEYETIIKTFVSNWLPMRKLTAFIYPV